MTRLPVRTAADLAALPLQAVVIDWRGIAWQKLDIVDGHGWWDSTEDEGWVMNDAQLADGNPMFAVYLGPGVPDTLAAASTAQSPDERGGYWMVTKPPHGWSCTCPETDQHDPAREWVAHDFDRISAPGMSVLTVLPDDAGTERA